MARQVDNNETENTDNEFPDPAGIIRNHKRGEELKATLHNTTKTPIRMGGQTQRFGISTVGLQSTGTSNSSEDAKGSAMHIEKPRSRRRVLKKIYDNPLLRPLDQQKESAFMTTSQRLEPQSKALPTIASEYTEAKSNKPSSISSMSEHEIFLEDSTGLSDFIVNDSSSLEETSTDDETQLHPPRSRRKLVKGRRPLDLCSPPEGESKPINDSQSDQDRNKLSFGGRAFIGEIEGKETLQFSNNALPGVNPRGRSNVTPPSSSHKTQKRLLSPKKGPRIPMTPHRPSMDAFWDPDVINDWNEEYSPRKTPKTQYRTGDGGLEIGIQTSPSKNKLMRNAKTQEAKKSFASKKHGIAENFLRELDAKITDGKVSEMAALTGGIRIIWSKKLNTTAGRANWKRETMRSTTRDADGKPETKIAYRHHASIELAEKVIDDEERLLNVIAHEFCHLANFMVSGIRNNPHGKEFKGWAGKCSQQFGARGIHVTTKHSYDIDYKYIWECTNCGTEFKRHSKSIDPSKHQCGSCKSKLVQIKPMPRANAVMNEYQVFVKENMKKVKEQNPGSPQKKIMTMVGKMYQEHKVSKLGSTEETLGGIGVGCASDTESREEFPNDSPVDVVMRKLNFLDLTSP
jgi:predicted SprT family Zn-dependent metalloprotease